MESPEECAGQRAPVASADAYDLRRAGALTAQPVPALIETGQEDGTGVMPPPIRGAWNSPFGVPFLAAPQALAGFLSMALNNGTAGPVSGEVGAYGPTSEQTWIYANTSPEYPATMTVAIPDAIPPQVWRLAGTHLRSLAIEASADGVVTATVDGQALNFSRYGDALPQGVPVGTHPGPTVVGQPDHEKFASNIFVRITDVGQADPFLPVKFKVIVSDVVPALIPPGDSAWTTAREWHAEYAIDTNGANRGVYRELYDETGAAVGPNERNSRHPVLIAFPGTITDHVAGLAVDDIYIVQAPDKVTPPTPVYVDESLFTMASVRAFITPPGGTEFEVTRQSAAITWTREVDVNPADWTNFGTRATRPSQGDLLVAIPDLMSDTTFQTLNSTGSEFAARFLIEGRQIGAASLVDNEPIKREVIEVTMPVAKMTEAALALGLTGNIPESRVFRSGPGFSVFMRWVT
jgi:hypothetical protein